MNDGFGGAVCRGSRNLVTRGALITALCGSLLFASSGVCGAQASRQRPAARGDSSKAAPATYESLVQEAKRQLTNHQSQLAQAAAERAISLDGERYEAHVIAAAALRDRKQYQQATRHLQTALALAPDEARSDILRAITEVRMVGLPPDARRRLDAVMLVVEDADKASSADERHQLVREFMVRSNAFLEDYSFVAELWLLRAAASLELDYPETGWIAARKLAELGVADSNDTAIRAIMAQLERKLWLAGGVPIRDRAAVAGAQIDFSDLKQHPQYVCLEGPIKRGPGYYCDTIVKLATEGDAYWQEIVGEVYEGGVHPRSWASSTNGRAEAVGWYQKAAEQGFGSAADRLWRLAELAKDDGQVKLWARKAANLGLADAQYVVGRMYASGREGASGVKAAPQDTAEALRWFRRSAAQEYAPAELELAGIYRRVSNGNAEALRWYRHAVQHASDSDTRNSLAWLFATDPDPQFRNGTEAVRLASAVCDATKYENGMYVDTLAAAYAETGDWTKALAMQQKAIEALHSGDTDTEGKYIADFRARLEQYRSKQPYRERQAAQQGR